MTQCFVLSRDLMFSAQVSGAARSAELDVRTVGGVEQVEPAPSVVVILDLSMPGVNVAETVALLREQGACVIAVGPHVQEARLRAAADAGCDHVLSKGQASRELGELLASCR